MKIRLKGNSVRFRLSKTDISNFRNNGFVEERTEFPGNSYLVYRLEKKNAVSEPEASFTTNCICIFVPENMAEEWTNSDTVGYSNEIITGPGKKLSLLIEKDFACIDHSLEDQSDNYPNPNKVC